MNRLKKRRMELGLLQQEVADAIGVTNATISRYESGDISSMRQDKVIKYAKVLGVSPEFILGVSDDLTLLPDLPVEYFDLGPAEKSLVDDLIRRLAK